MPSFSMPFGLPRRYIVLCLALIVLLLFTLVPNTRELAQEHIAVLDEKARNAGLHPIHWLPEGLISNSPFAFGNKPPEFDDLGRCLFLSPFDALSPEEKARAEQVELEEVSLGIIRARSSVFHAPIDRKLTNPAGTTGGGVAAGNETEADKMRKEDKTIGTGQETLTNPILGLLRDGERKWQDMIARQSQTLDQAVEEYKTRYNRNPPKGFDDWWTFTHAQGVLLPDEYDAILNALTPFYAFSPAELEKRNQEAEKTAETFTLIIKKGKVELQWNDDYSRDQWWASRPRADAQINLMEPFLSALPDFRATFTIHDQPSIMPTFERMDELRELARKNQHTKTTNEKDYNVMQWRHACPADSPGRLETHEPVAEDTFVSSHLAAMDPCQHTSILENHGMALEVKNAESQPKPHTRILPIFVPSKTVLHADIPITPVGKDGRRDDVGLDPDWNAKSGKLYWRGLATGLQHNKGTGQRWRESHRERLHALANDISNAVRNVLVPIGRTGRAEVKSYKAKDIGQYYMDVKMSGGPWQCDWGDGSCDEMKQEYEFGSKDGPERSNEFKYVFDVDGNAWSSRFPRLMASRNMVIKASIFPEWNTQTLPEWYAYVPAKIDYSDLYSIMAFFRGTPKGKGGHDEVARRIASNGQCWVEKTWRREDMQAYMFRLYLEFARVMSPERDSGKMDYIHVPRVQQKAQDAAAAAIPDIEA